MLHHRQLAVIIFTGIEGYTAAMQESGKKAINLKDRHRQGLQQAHKQFNGRMDGT